ncbi:MAG: hypothetical protein ABIP29_06815, partial [Candidatus Eisenbacteria bacterium]
MSRTAQFRPGLFETMDSPSIVSFGTCLILGAAFMVIVQLTPVKSFESLTLDQLPERVTRLLLNESELAQLSAPERAALSPEAVAPSPDGTATPREAAAPEAAPSVSRVAPPQDAVGLPGSEPGDGTGGDGSGGGGGPGSGGPAVGARGAA